MASRRAKRVATAGHVEASARTILIVDDDVVAAQLMATLAELAGHVVHLAHDGAAAVEAFGRHRPDVVLSDIRLPGLDGYEVARRIRRSEGGREAVLIAATGFGRADGRLRATEAGFDHHLVKPFDFKVLGHLMADPTRPEIRPRRAGSSEGSSGS